MNGFTVELQTRLNPNISISELVLNILVDQLVLCPYYFLDKVYNQALVDAYLLVLKVWHAAARRVNNISLILFTQS